jgi:hypothetical protein
MGDKCDAGKSITKNLVAHDVVVMPVRVDDVADPAEEVIDLSGRFVILIRARFLRVPAGRLLSTR